MVSLSMFLMFALAAAPDPDEVQAAARALAAEGKPAEAAERLEALARAGHPRVLLAAGDLRSDAGHHAHAWHHYTRYLEQGLPASERAAAEAARTRLAAVTREIVVRLPGEPAEARIVARRLSDPPPPPLEFVALDGVTAFQLDLQAWELQVEAPGYAPGRAVVPRSERGSEVVLTLERLPPPATPPPAAPPKPAPVKRGPPGTLVAGAVLLPLGLAALGGTLAVLPGYIRDRSAFDQWQAELTTRPATMADLAALDTLAATARRQERLMAGLGAAAGVLTTVGAILLVRGQRERNRRLTLDARPGAVFLGMTGRF